MSLLIGARWRALAHQIKHIREFPNHRIWRLYRWFGFDTLWIGCECGEEFGRAPHFWLSSDWARAHLRHAREIMRKARPR